MDAHELSGKYEFGIGTQTMKDFRYTDGSQKSGQRLTLFFVKSSQRLPNLLECHIFSLMSYRQQNFIMSLLN
jgi:hypothetical protein